MKKILFAIVDNGMGLVRSRWSVCFTTAVMSLRNVEMAFFPCSYPYPSGAMNLVTAAFMDSNYDRLVTIDADLVFQPHHLELLLSHDVPFIAGLYPKKEQGLVFPAVPLVDNALEDAEALKATPVVEMEWVARGFTNIHRDVFDQIAQPCTGIQMWTHPENGREYPEWWQLEPGGHSEDMNFCHRYRSLGGRILLDSRCLVKHEGTAIYPLK